MIQREKIKNKFENLQQNIRKYDNTSRFKLQKT